MNILRSLKNLSIDNHGLYYKLSIIFSLFFLTPIGGFLYFAMKYSLLQEFRGHNT